MGEVREKVKLTNLSDLYTFEQGFIPEKNVRTIEADALVDTGSVMTVLPESVFNKLGLSKEYEDLVEYADGRRDVVSVSKAVRVQSLSTKRRVDMNCVVLGNEVILGQMFLEQTDLIVDCNEKRIAPNPAHQGQAVIKIK